MKVVVVVTLSVWQMFLEEAQILIKKYSYNKIRYLGLGAGHKILHQIK